MVASVVPVAGIPISSSSFSTSIVIAPARVGSQPKPSPISRITFFDFSESQIGVGLRAGSYGPSIDALFRVAVIFSNGVKSNEQVESWSGIDAKPCGARERAEIICEDDAGRSRERGVRYAPAGCNAAV